MPPKYLNRKFPVQETCPDILIPDTFFYHSGKKLNVVGFLIGFHGKTKLRWGFPDEVIVLIGN